MRHIKADRSFAVAAIAAVISAHLAGAIFLSPAATLIALAQSEPARAANGVLLPPLDFDPAAARIVNLADSQVVTTTATAPEVVADESTATDASGATADSPETTVDAPDASADAPDDGNSVTTSLGGADVAVSSVGGSNEVDGPRKRSDRK